MGGDGTFTVGPGFWGFVAFFVMAIALWLLVRNMSGRLRRMAYQERDRDGAVNDPRPAVPGERAAPPTPMDLSSPDGPQGAPDTDDPPEQPSEVDAASSNDTPRDETT